MYALKRRQKQFYDQKIISKQLQEGDLVLVYTLKQHDSKLTKRGKGPFVIHSLSPSGAVQLATLEGEPMANWISGGCRLKKYHLPLTDEMLQQIHMAKQRKNEKEVIKEHAQNKARQRRENGEIKAKAAC